MIKPTDVEDRKLFQGVTNDDQFIEAQVRKELKQEKEQLEREKKDIEQKLVALEEKVKGKKAARKFVGKKDFLLHEQLYMMETFLIKLVENLKQGDTTGIESEMRKQLYNVHSMNIYLSSQEDVKPLFDSDNQVDILYDFGPHGQEIYKRIKENNVNNTRTNERLRKIKIRKTDWIPFQSTE